MNKYWKHLREGLIIQAVVGGIAGALVGFVAGLYYLIPFVGRVGAVVLGWAVIMLVIAGILTCADSSHE